MKNTLLEAKLLEIEAKRPFHDDDDMIKAIESILKKEYRRKELRQNDILIHECLDTLLMLRGYDIDKLNAHIESTQAEALNRIHEKIRLEQGEEKARRNIQPKRYQPVLISLCIVICLIMASVAGYAIGIDPIKRVVDGLFNIPVGESITEGNHEYVRVGEVVTFDTVDELVENLQLSIIYPSYLPKDMTLTKIRVSNLLDNASTVTFNFSSGALIYTMDTYEAFDYSSLAGQLPTYESNDIVYYILDEQSRYTVYFEHDAIQYSLQYNDYDELIKIINSMEEYK